MCGIAGLIEAPGAAVDEASLGRMADALVHRGPDDGRTWRGPSTSGLAHVGLAHRRLSVLDHRGGAQPMHGSDVVVVFNGQIYNHLALRTELAALGAAFASDHSDTEVLVHGVRFWGVTAAQASNGNGDGDAAASFCARLSGMFAFAAVDTRRRTLLLARDPMGQKPLYVAGPGFFDDGKPRLAFASELSALERLPRARRAVDPAALARYFAFDFVPDPDCIYQGVIKLPPGTLLELPLDDTSAWSNLAGRARPYRALSFLRGAAALPRTHHERVERLRAVLVQAVAKRMVADVPVGIFLSGGVDSSLVAALAARRSSKVETFSIAFREASYDESRWARRVAAHIGAAHHEETLDERALLDVLPRLARHLSEPFADHSIIPTYLLSSFARESVTVALGGDGGDELFLGYPTFQVEALRPAAFDHATFATRPAFARLLAVARRLPVSHEDFSLDFKLQRTLDGLAEPSALRRHQLFLTGATDARVRRLLAVDPGPGDMLAVLDDLERAAAGAGARDTFDVLQVGYARTYLAAGVLQKVDRASMAASLEVRAPLLDNDVVDLALALPSSEKLHRLRTKAILKDVAVAAGVPREVVHRRKKGFGVPVASWLAGPLRPLVDELLSRRALEEDGALDARVVRALVDEHMQRRANHRKQLWSILMYRLWRTRPREPAQDGAHGPHGALATARPAP